MALTALAALVCSAVVTQVFLAGLGLLVDPSYLAWHSSFVHLIELAVFVMSATLAGLAGATKAVVFQLASLSDVYWTMSGEVVLMTLLGGMGTIFGPIAGAVVIVTVENYFAGFGAWVTVIQGVIFVVSVLVFREGIVGVLARWTGKSL